MSDRPPFDDVRSAFERLGTSDKAAFVLEATFETIGQAIGETGRRVGDAVSSLDLDALFRMDGTPPAPEAPPTAPPTPRKPAAKKTAGKRKPNPSVPPTDDAPPAV